MKNSRFTPLTILLVGTNLIVSIFLVRQFGDIDPIPVLGSGALFAPYTLGDQPFSLLSHMFLHDGVFHLFFNMISLYTIGQFIERRQGGLVLALVYFISGFTAAIIFLYTSPMTMGLGASGAIFGLFGFHQTSRINSAAQGFLIGEVAITIGVLVVSLIFSIFLPVGIFAHAGGFITGVFLYYLARKRPAGAGFFHRTGDIGFSTSIFLATIVIPILLYTGLSRFPVHYLHFFRYMSEVDNKIIATVNAQYTSAEEMYEAIRNVAPMPARVLDSLSATRPKPGYIHSDTAILYRYWSLRKRMLDYAVMEIEQKTYRYRDSVWITSDSMRRVPALEYFPDPLATLSKDEQPEEPADSAGSLTPVEVYYDADWRPISDDHMAVAYYFRRGTKDSLGRWQGYVADYYISGAIQMKGTYKDNKRHGVFLTYSEDSTYLEAGQYANDDIVGWWEDFHPNGQLAYLYEFGPQSAIITRGYNLQGEEVVKEGAGMDIRYHENGNVQSKTPIVEGKQNGQANGFFPDGRPHYREVYEDGELIRGVAIDDEGMRHTYDAGQWLAMPEGGLLAYDEYLEENNQMKTDTTDGPAIIRFDVNKYGELSNFRVIKSAGLPLDMEAIRLIRQGPAWSPALKHGYQPQMSEEEVPVYF
ncbi:rhomboid family intramembrane serine protease [Roseivirga sp. BDSF3-8]|uniref:rhomboid family intramembrane serine protease n=1 Tax=Roseivirga sp. BDSF3-8 TaxID=3241598 RepID=UPI003532784C